MVEAARGVERRRHDRMRSTDIDVAVADRGTRPDGQLRAVFGDRAVADQQTHEVALVRAVVVLQRAGPGGRFAMILQQYLVACLQIAGGAPLGHEAEPREGGDAAHSMIRSEPQRVPFGRRQFHQRLDRGAEEAFGAARMIHAVHARVEWLADELGHLARAFAGLHPGVGGDAGVGGADVLAPPVVVHLVDAVDEDETRFGEVIRRRHDDVPHAARRQCLVNLAADQSVFTRDVGAGARPLAPHELGGVVELVLGGVVFLGEQRKGEVPVQVLAHRVHEFVGDQQREIELAQAAVLALGADEFHGVGMADVEGAHLRAAAAAGRRHGETHLVVDIHERQRAGGVCAGARHVRAARAQRREFITDAAAGFEREAGLVHLVQDVVHRVDDGPGHGAVDGGRRGLVLQRAGVGRDAAGRNGAAAQGPDETLVPLVPDGFEFDIRQGAGHALVGVVHGLVDGCAVFGGQAIFLVPDIERRFLERNRVDVFVLEFDHAIHGWVPLPRSFRTVFPINARTGERTALPPYSWRLHASLYEATAVRQPPNPLPGSPTTQDVATQHLVLGSEE